MRPERGALRPEAMYWLADSSTKISDNVKAYRTFKKITWDYPESEWAKAARGRLTEEIFSRMAEQEQTESGHDGNHDTDHEAASAPDDFLASLFVRALRWHQR